MCRSSEESAERTFKEVIRIGTATSSQAGQAAAYPFIMGVVSIVLVGYLSPLLIKPIVSLWTLTDHFALTLRAISTNWARSIFSLDLSLSLELVPGYEELVLSKQQEQTEKPGELKIAISMADTRYSTLYRELNAPGSLRSLLLSAIVLIACVGISLLPLGGLESLFTLMYCIYLVSLAATPWRIVYYAIPAIAYRWSVKATSVVYWPLLFSMHSLAAGVPLRFHLESIRDGKLAKFKRFFSYLILVVIGAKVFYWSLLVRIRDSYPSDFIDFIVNDYLSPSMNGWQWASGVNAIISIVFYWIVDYWLRRMNSGLAVDEGGVRKCLSYLGAFCAMLSIYSIWANISILVHSKPFLTFPSFGALWPN